MAGFSIVLLLSGFVGAFLLFMALAVIYYIWQICKYLLYSFSVYGVSKDKKAFIPIFNKYIFGEIGINKIYGIVLAVVTCLKVFIDIWFLDFILVDVNLLVFNLVPNLSFFFVLFVFVAHWILTCICASKLFEKKCNKTIYIILTVLSYLSLGMLIPVFMFFINKTKKESKEDLAIKNN